jgi:hypothetical protein
MESGALRRCRTRMRAATLWSTAVVGAIVGITIQPTLAEGRRYRAEPIEATVVDAKSGIPIGGARVAAQWILVGPMENARFGALMVMETVTDEKGRFTFPGWGPKESPPLQGLSYDDPELIVFSPEYVLGSFANFDLENVGEVRRSQWNRGTIRLDPFSRSTEAYIAALDRAAGIFDHLLREDRCDWRQVAGMLGALTKEQERAANLLPPEKRGVGQIRDWDHMQSNRNRAACGSVDEYVRTR